MYLDLSTPDTNAYAKQISTESLGDHSYIVVVGSEAVAVDIQRDLERFDDVLDGFGATLVAVFETHIHNDYVSGGKRLADQHGATYVLPANTGAPYDHTPLSDGDSMAIGEWAMRAMHTPGHTRNHTSYVLESPEGPVAIFSGGSMLVGSVGRSDLLGPEHTETLLRSQYRSMHRIVGELPEQLLVAPTHGSGSFCSASEVAATTSTIGLEKLRNPALAASSAERFATDQIAGYKRFPAYYRHMARLNLKPMGAPPQSELPNVEPRDVAEGATIVDIRPFAEYAAGHIPGSLSYELSNDTAVYMGWTLEWGAPLVLVGSGPETEVVRLHLQRIGWDNVVGRIDPSSLDHLSESDIAKIAVVSFPDIGPDVEGAILDVRDRVEQLAGVIPGTDLVHFSDVAADPDRFVFDDGPVIYCASGARAGIAASCIKRAGGRPIVVKDDLANYRGTLVAPVS